MLWYVCIQSDPDSGYHTGSGSVLNGSNSNYTPGERTLTREDLRRRISMFNSNNHGLIMEPVSWLCFVNEHCRVCVCVCVCLSVHKDIYLRNHKCDLQNFACCRCLWPWLGPVTLWQYVTYFRFCGWLVFSYNGSFCGMNIATKDRFRLNLLIYFKVGQNSISYY